MLCQADTWIILDFGDFGIVEPFLVDKNGKVLPFMKGVSEQVVYSDELGWRDH